MRRFSLTVYRCLSSYHAVAATRSSSGFTLLEVLVAMGLSSMLMTMIIGGVLFNQRTYYEAVVRLGINSNLRSAADIISTNIRQAGENLSDSFTAVVLENGASGASDTLRLRRNLLSDVLTLCLAATSGATTLRVSSTTITSPECVPANVLASYNTFEAHRASHSNTRIYIYNRLTKAGEFLNYNSSSIVSSTHRLSVSATSQAYPVSTTNIYMLEEYAFSRDAATNSLQLVVGNNNTFQTVAFNITDFQAELQMEDNSTLTAMSSATTTHGWRNIRQIRMVLTGQDQRKSQVFTSSIAAEYFPRNVLSE